MIACATTIVSIGCTLKFMLENAILKISHFRQEESPDFHQGVRGIFTKLLFNFRAIEEFDCNPEEEQEVGRGDDWRQVQV